MISYVINKKLLYLIVLTFQQEVLSLLEFLLRETNHRNIRQRALIIISQDHARGNALRFNHEYNEFRVNTAVFDAVLHLYK